VPENEKQDGIASRKAKVEQSTRETTDSSNGGLHYKVTSGSWERCNPSGL